MQKLKILVAVILLSGGWFCMQSCCKVLCAKSAISFRLIHFSTAELDTLLSVRYQPNGQFNNKTDSSYNYQLFAPPTDTVYFYILYADLEKDWKIKIPAAAREYNVSDLRLKSFHCNCGQGRGKRVDAYKVDGVQHDGEYIDLVK